MNAQASPTHADDPLWYKDAVIYQLHLKSFFDANNDGIGDFKGLIEKLDYIAELGVTAIWMLPFYPSPRRDDGYDIADYRGVHPDYGSLSDVRRFIEEAHNRNIKVIAELVINHTSDQHPWFQRARSAPPGSPERDFYVWSDDDDKYGGTRVIFLDTEKSNWTWDESAQARITGTASTQPPTRLEFRQSGGVMEAVLSDHAFLARHGSGRVPPRRHSLSRGTRRHEQREPGRETHEVIKEIARRAIDRHATRTGSCWPRPINGRRTCGNTSAMATSARWPTIFR